MQDNRTIPISFKSPLSREFFYEHIIKKIQSLKCKGAHMPSKTKTSWRKEEKNQEKAGEQEKGDSLWWEKRSKQIKREKRDIKANSKRTREKGDSETTKAFEEMCAPFILSGIFIRVREVPGGA